MENEIIFIVDGEEVATTAPDTTPKTNVKVDDKGIYTLTTKNALKLSNHVKELLKLNLGDKIGYRKANDKVFIFADNNDPTAKPITALGSNKSYVRLTHAQLWEDLKGNDKTTIKYELKEVQSKDGKLKAYLLELVAETKKQNSGKKTKSAPKKK